MTGKKETDVTKIFEGIEVSTDNAVENLRFIQKSKELAKTHDWLYHCTTTAALKSIVRNREFWLSNLKCVNDKEEAERIDVSEYEDKYYICCFTYNPQVPDDHWEEYGNESDGVLIGIKTNWFLRKAIFMCSDNTKCNGEFETIVNSYDDALKVIIAEQKKGRVINPFYINAFDFYEIKYDDKLVKNISGIGSMNLGGDEIQGRILTPEIVGIIKSTHGICRRPGKTPYDKDWTTEKEVRLKVGVQQLNIFANGYEIHDGMIMQKAFFPKIAVPVSDEAFKVVKIGFSPQFTDRKKFIEELQKILPESVIEVI